MQSFYRDLLLIFGIMSPLCRNSLIQVVQFSLEISVLVSAPGGNVMQRWKQGHIRSDLDSLSLTNV
jgi:hypothetical protein